MSICMHACVYKCGGYTCPYVYVFVYVCGGSIHANLCACVCILGWCTCPCMCMSVYAHVCVGAYACVCMLVYVCKEVYTSMCVHACVCEWGGSGSEGDFMVLILSLLYVSSWFGACVIWYFDICLHHIITKSCHLT